MCVLAESQLTSLAEQTTKEFKLKLITKTLASVDRNYLVGSAKWGVAV